MQFYLNQNGIAKWIEPCKLKLKIFINILIITNFINKMLTESFIIFTKMNCQDQEFLDKLEVYQKFQPILKEMKEMKEMREIREMKQQKKDKINLNELSNLSNVSNKFLTIQDLSQLNVQPLFHKMLEDYISIIENDKIYFFDSLQFTKEELLDYDKNITYLNNILRIHKEENFEHFQLYKVKIINLIKELLAKCESVSFSYNKILVSMIMFKILETEFGELFIQGFPNFQKTVSAKLKEFENENEKFPSFCKYLKDNYDTNKKYISKHRNKRYNLRRLRTILFASYALIAKLKEIRVKIKEEIKLEIKEIEEKKLENNQSWFSWFY